MHLSMTSMVCICVYDSHSGVMPFTVTASHSILSSSVPSAIVGGNALPYDLHGLCNNAATGSLAPLIAVLHSPYISAAQGTQCTMNDRWSGLPVNQCTGSGSHMHVPATGPVLNQHEGPQSFSPAAVQFQFNSISMDVPVTQLEGLAPVHVLVSRHSSGVEQQQPMPHDYTGPGALNVSGNHANTNTGNAMLWTGSLYLNGVYAQARASKTEAVRDPYAHSFRETPISLTLPRRMLSAWPKILSLECVAAPNISTLDIQAWLHETAAPLVRIHGTDSNFDRLVGEVRNSGDVSLPRRWLPALAISRP